MDNVEITVVAVDLEDESIEERVKIQLDGIGSFILLSKDYYDLIDTVGLISLVGETVTIRYGWTCGVTSCPTSIVVRGKLVIVDIICPDADRCHCVPF
jgi:hypothetical protein